MYQSQGALNDTFTWKTQFEKESIRYSGFIAQDVEKAAIEVGYDFSGIDKPKNDIRLQEITIRDLRQRTERNQYLVDVKDIREAREYAQYRLFRTFVDQSAEAAFQLFNLVIEPNLKISLKDTKDRVDELVEKAKSLNTKKYVLKAQIHAGGRGKAGGVKILDTIEELGVAAKELLGKTLVTHQTGPEGREVKRLYVEESSNIDKEFYLSCLIDRASSKIVFISSDQGGMDIEEVASSSPEKIITTKVDINNEISDKDCEEIVKIFLEYDPTITKSKYITKYINSTKRRCL